MQPIKTSRCWIPTSTGRTHSHSGAAHHRTTLASSYASSLHLFTVTQIALIALLTMARASLVFLAMIASQVSGYAFVAKKPFRTTSAKSSSALRMEMDSQIIQGVGIGVLGLAAGIGMVAFTEQQGERAKERGSGLSEGMSTRIAGGLMEDVEVSSVEDLGSLTAQLENALKESGGASEKEFEMSEEEKQKILDEADDGW